MENSIFVGALEELKVIFSSVYLQNCLCKRRPINDQINKPISFSITVNYAVVKSVELFHGSNITLRVVLLY